MLTFRQTRKPRRAAGARAGIGGALVLLAVISLASTALAADELNVRVSPTKAHALPGGEVAFAATAYDKSGDPVAADITWSVIPPRVGAIGSNGRFVAGNEPGRAIVRALAMYGEATGAGHSVVEVNTQPPTRLVVTVSPPSAVVEAGGQEQFGATATDPVTGDPVEAELRWVVIPERIGSIDGTGLFTAGSDEGAGRVAVRAIAGEREGVGNAAVVVGTPPGPGVVVSVAPAIALVSPGEEFQFNAVVTNESGNPLDADVEWSVMPRRQGVIGPDGLFTAGPDEGVGRIVATVATSGGPARGFARVEIRRPGPAGVRIRIRPREAAVTLGGDVQFEAIAAGPDGEPLDVPMEWSVRPVWLGSISADGLFSAADEMPEPPADGGWIGAVTASVETNEGVASDAARVVVRDSAPTHRLRISPKRPVLAPGQEIQFEAGVMGAEGPIDWTTEWAVFPRELGIITPDGLFMANPAFGDPASHEFGPYEGVVGASATLPDGSTLSDRAHVRIRVPGHPVSVRVRPALAIVIPGQTTHFEVEVLGPSGEVLDLPVFWDVRPEHLGHISPDGDFTAAELHIEPESWQRPRGYVVAEVRIGGGQVFRGTAAVVFDLADPEVSVHISPRSVTVSEGESFQFQVEASTGDGAVVDMNFEWRVADPTLGTVDAGGLFTAATNVPDGHSLRTTVIAGGIYGGRLYADFATVRVTRG
ncbi:MAG: Ig-like domain-containing protein [Candidatus Eisenbacteria bacterium]